MTAFISPPPRIPFYIRSVLQAHGITDYTWENLVTDYQKGTLFEFGINKSKPNLPKPDPYWIPPAILPRLAGHTSPFSLLDYNLERARFYSLRSHLGDD